MDYALVMDLLEYFCFAVKPTGFSGSMTFVLYDEAAEKVDGETQELEITVTIEKVEEEGVARPGRDPVPRPRVVVMLGGPPPEKEGVAASGTRSRVRISYDRFLLVYSGKASARDVINMGLQRKVQLTGFSAAMKFGFSFEYNKPTWRAYYAAKAEACLAEGGVADHQSQSTNASPLRSPRNSRTTPHPSAAFRGATPVAGTGVRYSGRENVARCLGEGVREEDPGRASGSVEDGAREDGDRVDATAKRGLLFSSDRFRGIEARRKLQQQKEKKEKHHHSYRQNDASSGADDDVDGDVKKSQDRDKDDKGDSSDRPSSGGNGNSSNSGGGGRRRWVPKWIRPRLSREGHARLGPPLGTGDVGCRSPTSPPVRSPLLTPILGGLFLPGEGLIGVAGVRRRRRDSSTGHRTPRHPLQLQLQQQLQHLISSAACPRRHSLSCPNPIISPQGFKCHDGDGPMQRPPFASRRVGKHVTAATATGTAVHGSLLMWMAHEPSAFRRTWELSPGWQCEFHDFAMSGSSSDLSCLVVSTVAGAGAGLGALTIFLLSCRSRGVGVGGIFGADQARRKLLLAPYVRRSVFGAP